MPKFITAVGKRPSGTGPEGGKRIREDEPHARGMRTTDATKCNVDLQIRGTPDIVNSVVVDVVPCVSDRNFEITGRCWESIWAAGVASCRKPGSRSRRFETTHHKARDMLKNVSLFYCTLTEGRFRLADRPFLFCAPAVYVHAVAALASVSSGSRGVGMSDGQGPCGRCVVPPLYIYATAA